MAVFNREDGQLALGSKTPVSILQEILQKKGMSPLYELIFSGVGTPDPQFKFRVSAEGLTAIGDGKSKKEAKHDAAATLLKRLLANKGEVQNDPVEEVDIASPYTGALKTNYVGILDDICFFSKIPPAVYVLVLEEGPPHARTFTMRCDVSCISEVAVARTKKQAKHLVAQKMGERLKAVLKDKFIPALENEECSEEIVSEQEKIRNGTFHHDMSHKVKDLHNVFHANKDEEPLPSVFKELHGKPEEYYDSMEKPLEFLEEIVKALEGIVKVNYVTQEDFETSLKELVGFFKYDECEEYENDYGHEVFNTSGVCSTRVDFDNILPDFPLDEEEDKDVQSVNLDSLCLEKKDLNSGEEINTEFNYDSTVHSFLKVEVPCGLWEFLGRGRDNVDALEQAARRALRFLRMMSIPAPDNLS